MSKLKIFTAIIQSFCAQVLVASCPTPIPELPALNVPPPAQLPAGTCSFSYTPDEVENFLPIVIVNNSGLDASEVYVTVLVNSLTQYLEFANIALEEGVSSGEHFLGIISDFTPTTYLSSTDSPAYSYPLSTFENIGGNEYVFYIPNTGNSSTNPSTVMKSSRIYLTLKTPLTYFIDSTGTLQIPSEFNAKNDNYFTLQDKIEFDVGSNGFNRLNLNLTGVDFFGLPLCVKTQYNFLYGGSYYEVCAETGMPTSIGLNDVFTGYTSALASLESPFNTDWGSLVAKYTNPPGAAQAGVAGLRIFAPATAMGSTQIQSNPTPVSFPTNYFLSSIDTPSGCTWYNAVWNGTTLSGTTAFYQETPTPYLILSADTDVGTGYATGCAFADGSFKFTITGTGSTPNPDKGATITFPNPSSSKAFFTGAVSDYQPAIISSASAATNAQVLKAFATSIIAGFFPINCQVKPSITIDKNYLQSNSSSYFQNNSTLTQALSGCSCVENIPWYDFYSRTLLTIGTPNLFYTSAYSDYLGTDGTIVVTSLNDHNADAVVKIYLGDCSTDVVIPEPYSDTTNYTVTIGIPANKQLVELATVGYGTSASGPFTPYTSGTFSSSGAELFVQVTYTAGIYNGQTFVSQVAPSVELYHPILPGGGNVVTDGASTTVYIGASP